jgi:hypothetical protein
MADDTMDTTDDVFDIDQMDAPKKKTEEDMELFRIYQGSKIPVARSVGLAWRQKFDATKATYEMIAKEWDEAYRYYNNTQTKGVETPRGVFKRGDSTENVVYSNINIMLPAVYGQDPDITINTTDDKHSDFVDCLKTLLTALIRRKQFLNAKPKMRRATGFALLTNHGVTKLDYVLKDDSRQMAYQQLQQLSDSLAEAKTPTEVEEIYGKIEALEASMEVREASGPKMSVVMPHNLFVDPYAELPDATDAAFMIERTFFPTAYLNARYADRGKGNESVLRYKPTHKATFTNEAGSREDGLGMVLDAMTDDVTKHEDEKRSGYRGLYYSECYWVWDKLMRRVYLFQRDDWTWPIWVWDDYLHLSRFFPYFIISFGLSTGGVTSVGEVSYYLDQQDEINEINRKVARIRRSIFDYFFYDSSITSSDDVSSMLRAVRGDSAAGDQKVLGIKIPEGKKLADIIMHLPGPDQNTEAFFKKEPILETINRVSNTSDALRGVQFKTNTNEAAVQSYQDAARISIGAKQDVVEDVMSDITLALAELCVQFMGPEEVSGIIGLYSAINWQNMSVQDFNSYFSMEVVAGSTEKPNSAFKKKEAVQIGQMLGQFSSAAPLTALKIMLKVLQNAFTEVVIKPEDWAQLQKEAEATLAQGGGTPDGAPAGPAAGGAPAPGGAPSAGAPGGSQPQAPGQDIQSAAMSLPPAVKQHIMQAKQQGASPDQLKQMVVSAIQQQNGGGAQGGQAPQPQQQPSPQH